MMEQQNEHANSSNQSPCFHRHHRACRVPAFAHPGSGICVMDNGQVFFVDTGYGIWKIDESGDVSSYAQADGHFLTEGIPTPRF